MNYFFKKDSFFATLFVFTILGLLYFNPFNTHIFNPLKVSLTDFSFNDLAFSQAHLSNSKDERIVIINIDTIGRKTIGQVIKHLADYKPKVIGLDILLPHKLDNANAELETIIKSVPQIVLSRKIIVDEDNHLSLTDNQFSDSLHRSGYVNFRVGENGVIRYYPHIIRDGSNVYESFSTSVIGVADSAAYKKIVSRNNTNEWINYKRTSENYYIFNYDDILDDKIDSSFLKDKIILIGLVSKDQNNIEDKHFTPLNSKLFGKSLPDMNGVVIQANIISMILDNDYILRIPFGVMFLFGLILTWLYMSFLLKYYIHKHIWFHLAAKLMELVLSILLIYFSILILRYFSISIDFTFVLIAIILSVDILYFYEDIRNWLEQKFSIVSIFNKKTH